jgi:hypothetical protein
VKLGKSSQKKWQFETSVTMRSPGLEFNDIGYMRYSDIIHHGTWVAYYIRNPFAIFNNFYLNTNYFMYWNFSGKLIEANTNMNFNSQFKNRWRINGSFTRKNENISIGHLRGGPSYITPGDQSFHLNLSTDQSKKISFYTGIYNDFGDAESFRFKEYWGGVFIRPSNSVSISLEPIYNTQNNKSQYIETAGSEQNPIYLFGELNQKTLSLTFRINYTINPELTIEYYGQPFVSAGKYTNLNKITDPQAGRFRDRYHIFSDEEITLNTTENTYNINEINGGGETYSISNPDFNFRQFRSNLVVRWEYSPGSTVYLVWSQGRTSSESNGRFSYGNDLKDLFQIVPHNVFLVKFSYWFSI